MLRSVLGKGATGVVWRATHEALTRDYAIKFLEPGLTGTSSQCVAERFHFEAQVSCRLGADMDNIVAVHDAGVFRGQPYMVMDLVRGDALQALIRRGPLHINDISRVVSDIGSALTVCHAEGVAHRDTKPANILFVESTKRYKLTDFGLAKYFGEAPSNLFIPRETVGTMMIGTPAYMSPEAISGDKTRCGRGDVWSLAVTAYECLTRTLPFQGEGWPSVAVSIMKRKYRHPSQLHPELARFDSLFVKAFAADIDDRFQTPAELVEALDAVIAVSSKRMPVVAAVPISLTPMTVRAVRPSAPSDPQVSQSFAVDSTLPRPHSQPRARGRWIALGVVVAVAALVSVAFVPSSDPVRSSRRQASRAIPSSVAQASASTESPTGVSGAPSSSRHVSSAWARPSSSPRPARSADALAPKPFDQSEVW